MLIKQAPNLAMCFIDVGLKLEIYIFVVRGDGNNIIMQTIFSD